MSESTPRLQWNRVLKELQDGGGAAAEWPHPDYYTAAQACGTDAENLEKLRRLSEDLETVVSLQPGPGSFACVAGVPTHQLAELDGQSWREVLTGPSRGRLIWLAILNYGRVLQSSRMDAGSRRTGRIFMAVARSRLVEMGETQTDAKRDEPELASECRSLRQKSYVPEFICAQLKQELW